MCNMENCMTIPNDWVECKCGKGFHPKEEDYCIWCEGVEE